MKKNTPKWARTVIIRRRRLSAKEWRLRRMRALNRAGWRCECGCKRAGRLEVDHIIPLAQGGGHQMSNLKVLTRDCHILKTSRENRKPLTPEEQKWSKLAKELASTADVVE